ncbi:MAG: acetolactate synthase small subunit [Clostridia bacterium]|jgi:acetolactate synthase-1/3 small subunit|nr:acetolactate synthase small subunit [Clostridia bacterium]MBQ2252007.1 acetolactate synthase small subunit [Clostridia bacterium]MBQ5602156.1 acetolactate synthase small subunit [Clostridia bacterium]
MNRYTVAVLVENKFGVLNRVTSMFRRRRFNIDALTVSETESPDYSRITVIFDGNDASKKQLVEQLYKLPEVCSIKELDSENSVSSELLLIKMENSAETREEIRSAAEAYDAKIVDYTREALMMQVTGDSRRIDDFINLMRDYKILEICRTGIVSLERGNKTIREELN